MRFRALGVVLAAFIALCACVLARAEDTGSDRPPAVPHPAPRVDRPEARLGSYVGTVGEMSAPATPQPKPVFIHIPKTGGTTIELAAANRGVRLGMCAANCDVLSNACEDFLPDQSYPTQPGYSKCSRVHRPPKFSAGIVPNSFCIVRNPFDRLISEFHYNRVMPWNKRPLPDTCAGFETWVVQVTDAILDSKMVQCHLRAVAPGGDKETTHQCDVTATRDAPWEDCHTLPQSLYTAGCETVLAKERWDEDVAPFLKRVASAEPGDVSSVYQYENDGEGVDDRCWVQLKWNTIQRVHRAYEADFRQFGYSATPGTAEAPTRGYTKPEYARRRAAALGAGRWTMRAQGEVDKDGVARCLKPLRRNFLNAMFQGGFIEPEFLNVLTEAQFSGRI